MGGRCHHPPARPRSARRLLTPPPNGSTKAAPLPGASPAAMPPQRPFTSEIRSLAVDDLDGDGQQEIVVARASGGSYDQWTVLEPDGSTRAGWPRLSSSEPGYGWGAYNQNIGVADIDGDGKAEI